ncbi:MAG: hypothetical protein LBH59_03845 [Planctomycetaceae bacterium]|nr:hypothetical protein [Planctomycetaceae bacterium]
MGQLSGGSNPLARNSFILKPVWAVGFALEQTLRDATLAVFSFLILKRLQHICKNYS